MYETRGRMYETRGHIALSSGEVQGRTAGGLSSAAGSRSSAVTLPLPLFGQPRVGAYVASANPRTGKKTALNY